MWLLVKTLLSALLIVAASEAGRRSPLVGAVLASLPLVSVLAMVWLFVETGDALKVARFARDVLWLVLPSLLLLGIVPVLLERGVGFFVALGIGIVATAAAYGLMVWWLGG